MATTPRRHVLWHAPAMLVTLVLVAASVGITAAPTRAGTDDFYSIVDTDGNTISGFELDAEGEHPIAGAPNIRLWGALDPAYLVECTSKLTNNVVTWCENLHVTTFRAPYRSCIDATYPFLDGSACFRFLFDPLIWSEGDTFWLRGQASATGVDGADNAYAFNHWSISGATNSEGTCQEGSASATCTVSFVPRSEPIHMTAVYSVADDDYAFSDFADPVDADALNSAKAGQSIPLKWRVTDAAGAPVSNLAAVSVTTTAFDCETSGTAEDPLEEYASGASGLQILGDGYYQYNWKTPKAYAGKCLTLHLDLGDGLDHTAEFKFTK
jgi:hypothetical protein